MTILIAPDKFKDALSAPLVCKAIAEGLLLANPALELIEFPLADGGEGTAEILTKHSGGQAVTLKVQDPLFRTTEAKYGISSDGSMAFIEMAAASGLKLLEPEERNCLLTTTYGTGEMIRDAIARGVKKIVLGIGGSATNDAGIGMAAALGYKFFDQEKNELQPIGQNLGKVASIDDSASGYLKDVEFLVACDVENPLHGQNGAAYIYAPQKGADREAVRYLDEGLAHFAEVADKQYKINLQTEKGAGAAGGLGAGAVLFLHAQLTSGIKLIMQLTNFKKELEKVDYIITGEGKLDKQSTSGKLIKGIADEAKRFHIPVIALCGTLEADPESIKDMGLTFATSIVHGPCTLQEALANTATDLKNMAFNIGRIL